jgi:hypothetical protein
MMKRKEIFVLLHIVTCKGSAWVLDLMIGFTGTSLQLQLIITAHTVNSF